MPYAVAFVFRRSLPDQLGKSIAALGNKYGGAIKTRPVSFLIGNGRCYSLGLPKKGGNSLNIWHIAQVSAQEAPDVCFAVIETNIHEP